MNEHLTQIQIRWKWEVRLHRQQELAAKKAELILREEELADLKKEISQLEAELAK